MTLSLSHPDQLLAGLTAPAGSDAAVAAANQAMTLVSDDRFARPLPALLTILPYVGPDELADMICARVLAGADLTADDEGSGLTSSVALVGAPVTVHDLRVTPSTMDGEGWPAYLLVDATYPDPDGTVARRPLAVGAKQAVTVLAREWLHGRLPVTGTFVLAAKASKGRSAPITFVVEEAL